VNADHEGVFLDGRRREDEPRVLVAQFGDGELGARQRPRDEAAGSRIHAPPESFAIAVARRHPWPRRPIAADDYIVAAVFVQREAAS
jgi:hypothetical protein